MTSIPVASNVLPVQVANHGQASPQSNKPINSGEAKSKTAAESAKSAEPGAIEDDAQSPLPVTEFSNATLAVETVDGQPPASQSVDAATIVEGNGGPDYSTVFSSNSGLSEADYLLDGKQEIKFASYYSSLQTANSSVQTNPESSAEGTPQLASSLGDIAVTDDASNGGKSKAPATPEIHSTGKQNGPDLPSVFDHSNRNPGGTGKFGLERHPKSSGPKPYYFFDQPGGRPAGAPGQTQPNSQLTESLAGANAEISSVKLQQRGETNTYRGIQSTQSDALVETDAGLSVQQVEIFESIASGSSSQSAIPDLADLSGDSSQFQGPPDADLTTAATQKDGPLLNSVSTLTQDVAGSSALSGNNPADGPRVFSGSTIPDASPAKQVATALKTVPAPSASDPVQTITVELHPVELGKLSIRVEQTGDSLSAQIIASEPASIELLQQDKSLLLETLEEMGFGDASLDIFQNQTNGENSESFTEGEFLSARSNNSDNTIQNKTTTTQSSDTGVDLIA
ncbi:MAG: flagellar hook-length control protein FliK [Planctomycetota bacterium]